MNRKCAVFADTFHTFEVHVIGQLGASFGKVKFFVKSLCVNLIADCLAMDIVRAYICADIMPR